MAKNYSSAFPIIKEVSSSSPRNKRLRHYLLGKSIGEGSMGKVRLGLNMRTNKWVAIKIIKKQETGFEELDIPDYSQISSELLKNEIARFDPFSTTKRDSSPLEEPTEFVLNLTRKQTAFIRLVNKTLATKTCYQQFSKNELKSKDARTLREILLGQLVYHPHICELKQVIIHSSKYYVVSELVNGRQLLQVISEKKRLSEKHARHYSRQISSAITYLHKHSIVHRDLKIENIMVNKNDDIKIIDFGLSNLYSFRKKLSTFCGSLYFAAPELLQASEYFGPETDCWSFGIIIYVLVCGKVPFDDVTIPNLHKKIKNGKFDLPNYISASCKELLNSLIVVDPVKRANINQVINSKWMNETYQTPTNCYIPDNSVNFPLVNTSQIDKNIVTIMAKYYHLLYFGSSASDPFNSILNELSSIINSPWYKDYLTSKYKYFILKQSFLKKNSFEADCSPNTIEDINYSINSGNKSDYSYHFSNVAPIDTSDTIYSHPQLADSISSYNALQDAKSCSDFNLLNLQLEQAKKNIFDRFSLTNNHVGSQYSLSKMKYNDSIEDNYGFLEGVDPLLSIYYMIQAKIHHYKLKKDAEQTELTEKDPNTEKPLPDKPNTILNKVSKPHKPPKPTRASFNSNSNSYVAVNKDVDDFTYIRSLSRPGSNLNPIQIPTPTSHPNDCSNSPNKLKNQLIFTRVNHQSYIDLLPQSQNQNQSQNLNPKQFISHADNNEVGNHQNEDRVISGTKNSASVMFKLEDKHSLESLSDHDQDYDQGPNAETFYETLKFLDNNPNYFRSLRIDSTEHKNLSNMGNSNNNSSKNADQKQKPSQHKTTKNKKLDLSSKKSGNLNNLKNSEALHLRQSPKKIGSTEAFPNSAEIRRQISHPNFRRVTSVFVGSPHFQSASNSNKNMGSFSEFKNKNNNNNESYNKKILNKARPRNRAELGSMSLSAMSNTKWADLSQSLLKKNRADTPTTFTSQTIANRNITTKTARVHTITGTNEDSDLGSLVSLLSILNSFNQEELEQSKPKKKKWLGKFMIKLKS